MAIGAGPHDDRGDATPGFQLLLHPSSSQRNPLPPSRPTTSPIEVIDDQLDRLYAAKAYLQSDEATANSEATREVVSEIAEEEYVVQRLKHTNGTTEKGQTHG